MIDHHFENVYTETNPHRLALEGLFFHTLVVFFIGSVIVGCVYKDLHELLLRNQSTGKETNTSR